MPARAFERYIIKKKQIILDQLIGKKCQLDEISSYIIQRTYITNLNQHTSFGSANIPTIAESIASWFSTREALAAIKTTVSTSTPFAKI